MGPIFLVWIGKTLWVLEWVPVFLVIGTDGSHRKDPVGLGMYRIGTQPFPGTVAL